MYSGVDVKRPTRNLPVIRTSYREVDPSHRPKCCHAWPKCPKAFKQEGIQKRQISTRPAIVALSLPVPRAVHPRSCFRTDKLLKWSSEPRSSFQCANLPKATHAVGTEQSVSNRNYPLRRAARYIQEISRTGLVVLDDNSKIAVSRQHEIEFQILKELRYTDDVERAVGM